MPSLGFPSLEQELLRLLSSLIRFLILILATATKHRLRPNFGGMAQCIASEAKFKSMYLLRKKSKNIQFKAFLWFCFRGNLKLKKPVIILRKIGKASGIPQRISQQRRRDKQFIDEKQFLNL
ncbi:hypothetical protein H0H92_004127 [Tricholoma furcatifolium]|nr:hypothetical protein H0H92_004127 [Tricholoma furcatifolium]